MFFCYDKVNLDTFWLIDSMAAKVTVLGGYKMGDPQRILIVDDDEDIARFLSLELTHEGYDVAVTTDGRAAEKKVQEAAWDVILLDVLLPGISGLEVCRRIRLNSDVPIIMLSARDEVTDRVSGLNSGADDYIVKPFAIEEILARVRSVTRRRASLKPSGDIIEICDTELNKLTREVHRNGQPVHLTAKEFNLLEVLMENHRQVLTRQQLLEIIWGYDFAVETNVVDVYVGYLRSKIDVPFDQPLIHTIRGVGFIFKCET